MNYLFDELKATQASAFIIQKYDGKLNYMKLLKILYIANRKALQECGEPIVPDAYVSMPHGPVLSSLLDKINNPSENREGYWDQHIEMAGRYEVHVRSDPGFGKLSRKQLRILDEVDVEWHAKTQYQIRDWTHDRRNVPEWRDPSGSSAPISVEEILLRGGWAPEQVDSLIEEETLFQKEEELIRGISEERTHVSCASSW